MMKKNARKFENTTDKIAGEIKEAAGKITGNEQLERKGKIQSSKADLKIKVNDVKEDIANAINHAFDKKGRK